MKVWIVEVRKPRTTVWEPQGVRTYFDPKKARRDFMYSGLIPRGRVRIACYERRER